MDRTRTDTCSLTELRRGTTACIARARKLGHPLLITRRGTAIAVLMTFEQYETLRGASEELAALVKSAGPRVDESDYRRHLEEKYL